MRTLIKIIASMVIVYLLACLVALNWTPFVDEYINSDYLHRNLILFMAFLSIGLIYIVIEVNKLIK